MKKNNFDIFDHFKGTFSKIEENKKELVISNAFDYIQSLDDQGFPLDYSGVYIGDITGEDVSMATDELECNHEPIDVGFSKLKMVCKKCDKDL